MPRATNRFSVRVIGLVARKLWIRWSPAAVTDPAEIPQALAALLAAVVVSLVFVVVAPFAPAGIIPAASKPAATIPTALDADRRPATTLPPYPCILPIAKHPQ